MKKLLKQEWKYYLFFALAMLSYLFMSSESYSLGMDPDLAQMFENIRVNSEIYYYPLDIFASDTNYLLLEHSVVGISFFILLLRAMIFWIEKDSYGREFFQTLPIRRSDRVKFHFMMDSLLILFVVLVYAVIFYVKVTDRLDVQEIELPWLGKGIFGEAVTGICYMLFLLAAINFLESVFVDGFIKIVGSISGMWMLGFILSSVFYMNQGNMIIQKIYGFLAMESAGGSDYVPISENSVSYLSTGWEWRHSVLQLQVLYKGKMWEPVSGDEYLGDAYRLYAFSHCSSYIGYALAYLALAIVIFGLVVWLSGKQELSKQGFYFGFGKYLFSAILSGTFLAILIKYAVSVWHKCFILAAAILLYILLIYCMTPDRKWRIRKK